VQLNNLTQEQVARIIYSLDFTLKNDPTKVDGIRETAHWVQLQQDEQKKGGPWKARLREAGHVI
jgi:hypothetical protein